MLTTPPPSWAFWQRIINSHDVPDPSTVVAAPEPIPVSARIVWGEDGEELVLGRAIRWTDQLVLVELRDTRSATIGPWLNTRDVRRSG